MYHDVRLCHTGARIQSEVRWLKQRQIVSVFTWGERRIQRLVEGARGASRKPDLEKRNHKRAVKFAVMWTVRAMDTRVRAPWVQ